MYGDRYIPHHDFVSAPKEREVADNVKYINQRATKDCTAELDVPSELHYFGVRQVLTEKKTL